MGAFVEMRKANLRFAHVPKNTKYILRIFKLIASPSHQRLHGSASVLRYTSVGCLVFIFSKVFLVSVACN